MKKIIIALCIICMLIVPISAIEGAGVVTATGLNIREATSTESNIITVLPNQQRVVVEGQSGDWYQINYQGTQGYVHSDYMDIMTIANGNYGKANPNFYAVNVRERPTTDSAILATIGTTSAVNIIGINSGWYKITTVSGMTGYIRADLLDITGKNTTITPVVSNTSTYSAPATSASSSIVSTAKNYLGVPYVWGGTSPYGFDCSGFVQYVYKQHGYTLNRTANAQTANGISVSRDSLRPGDLVFFEKTYNTYGASHVGIYIGDGQFIHASSVRGVTISSLYESYYNSKYYCARRIV